jgi:membrane-associated protein
VLPAVDPKHLIETFGTIGILAIIFAESGLLFGFFLPGDSLLFTAGLLSASHKGDLPQLNPLIIIPGCFVAAVVGAQVGYYIGKRVGPSLFRRPDSRFFKQEYLERTRHYFTDHGPKTVVLSRFVPVVRTFATVVAGIGQMDPRQFFFYNVVGALIWSVGLTVAGYVLGSSIKNVDRYLLPIIAVVIAVSFLPVAIEALRARRRSKAPS